jgi:hypothetical protein
VDTCLRGGSIFIGDVSPMNIFLGTGEYKELYSSALHSSVISSVKRGIYSIFIDFVGIFVNCNR